MRLMDEYGDLILAAACLLLFALAMAAAPSDARPHSHDGGRTWHAHVGSGQ